jgi:hypothetical protein
MSDSTAAFFGFEIQMLRLGQPSFGSMVRDKTGETSPKQLRKSAVLDVEHPQAGARGAPAGRYFNGIFLCALSRTARSNAPQNGRCPSDRSSCRFLNAM